MSQISIVPAPYSPFGISPSKVMYSSGWSSVWTALRFSLGSRGIPLGTAQETPTPSCSRRRSQCRRVASCCWTTKRGAPFPPLPSFRGAGSAVLPKSRLRSYSLSFAIAPRPYPAASLGNFAP